MSTKSHKELLPNCLATSSQGPAVLRNRRPSRICDLNPDFHFGFPGRVQYTLAAVLLSRELRSREFAVCQVAVLASTSEASPPQPHQQLPQNSASAAIVLDVTSMAFDVTPCNGAEVDKRPVRGGFCGVVAVGWSAREEITSSMPRTPAP